MVDMFAKGEALPWIYKIALFIMSVLSTPWAMKWSVLPVPPPTRMDKFTDTILDQGLIGMIGKSERSPATCEVIAKHGAIYLIAVGGAAYLVSKAIKGAKVFAFPELGMEAIYEFEVEDMPVTVLLTTKATASTVLIKISLNAPSK